MNATDLYEPITSRKIAKILAKFHALEMPFVKEPKWLFDTTTRYLKKIETSVRFSNQEEMLKFEKLLSYNLQEEFKILM